MPYLILPFLSASACRQEGKKEAKSSQRQTKAAHVISADDEAVPERVSYQNFS